MAVFLRVHADSQPRPCWRTCQSRGLAKAGCSSLQSEQLIKTKGHALVKKDSVRQIASLTLEMRHPSDREVEFEG